MGLLSLDLIKNSETTLRDKKSLTRCSRPMFLSYRNHSLYLLFKSIDWFLYYGNIFHLQVNQDECLDITLLVRTQNFPEN